MCYAFHSIILSKYFKRRLWCRNSKNIAQVTVPCLQSFSGAELSEVEVVCIHCKETLANWGFIEVPVPLI